MTVRRRSRGEIDRHYLFGDVMKRTGGALLILMALLALGTPFTLVDALDQGLWQYVVIVAVTVALGIVFFFGGRALQRTATHWDND
jgi:hypothetical protein